MEQPLLNNPPITRDTPRSLSAPLDEKYGDFDETCPSEMADKIAARCLGITHATFDSDGITFGPAED